MALDCIFPSLKHLLVVLLFICNPPSVLEFSELGGSFFVHLLLEFFAHVAFAFANLHENVGLVGLAGLGGVEHFFFMRKRLSFDLSINELLFVIF